MQIGILQGIIILSICAVLVILHSDNTKNLTESFLPSYVLGLPEICFGSWRNSFQLNLCNMSTAHKTWQR